MGTFLSKADALLAIAEVELTISRGTWVDPNIGGLLFSEYATSWLRDRHDLSPRTVDLYGYLLDKYVLPEFGNFELREITPPMVRRWNAHHAVLHASTASKAYRLLATIMRTAVADELLTASPCRVKGASQEHPEERPIATVEEVAALTTAMPPHLRITVDLAVWCQLRRGEILGLQRRDIDLTTGIVTIERSRTYLSTGESIIKEPKTKAGRRSLVIPGRMRASLSEHLDEWVSHESTAFIVCGLDGLPSSAMAIQRAWNKARATINREDLHFHDLRHTGLTLAASTGATTAELMRRAGHASPDAALRYQHATLERDVHLSEMLDRL